jgi:hypothetical protein
MTEQMWLACADPHAMLAMLGGGDRRRLRLFAAACCRRVWPLIADEESRRAVEAAERLGGVGMPDSSEDSPGEPLQGQAPLLAARAARDVILRPELAAGRVARVVGVTAALAARGEARERLGGVLGRRLAEVPAGLAPAVWQTLALPTLYAVRAQDDLAREAQEEAETEERRAQADLLRCLFGNPFRRVSIEPLWRTSDVLAVARGIDEERAFERLPLLGDALEDAGCTDEQVLGHCRGGGLHAPGCFLVEGLLGRGS